MRLVGYCRVSSESQADNTSLGDQESKIKAYCQALGHELIAVYSEVGSGKTASTRPQFQQALAKLTDADGLIAVKLDRIARHCLDVLLLVNDLKPTGKHLILCDLNLDTSNPTGMAMLTMMAAVAELERSLINERCQSGKKAKAATGGYIGGHPKFGESAKDGELVSNLQELEVIEVIRRHHKSGKSLRAIATYLNQNGYPAKHGGTWGATSVKRVLDRLHSKGKATK
jgi:DNA invertase Pin-like site-specific DNA recombinase